jgi:hypothetical protein
MLLMEEVCAAKHDARGTSRQDLHLVMKVPTVMRVEMVGDFMDVDRQAALAQRISPQPGARSGGCRWRIAGGWFFIGW